MECYILWEKGNWIVREIRAVGVGGGESSDFIKAVRVDLIEKGTLSKDLKEKKEFALFGEKGLCEKREKQVQRP